MPPSAKTCPRCGSPLTAATADTTRLVCPGCGVRFAARAKKAALPAAAASPARANPFSELGAAESPSKPETVSRAPARPAGSDPRLRMALVVGGALAVAFLTMTAALVLAIVLWPRGNTHAMPVAVVTPPDDPAPPPQPSARTPEEKPAPAKPATPAEPDKPAPAPPPPDKAPPPDLNPPPPRPNPAPPDPMPAPMPDVKPAPPDMKTDDPIAKAVVHGVAYLKEQIDNNFKGDILGGNRPGVMALAGLALLESGVPADDPDVQKAAAAVRGQGATLSNTYEMAICVWFLDRLGEAQDEELIRSLAMELIAGQTPAGIWTYVSPSLNAEQQKDLLEVLQKHEPGEAIPAKPGLPPVCQYVRGKKMDAAKPGDPLKPGALGNPIVLLGGGDLSLTQFAVLGLWVARRHNVPVDRSLLMTEAHCRGCQATDGSWSYQAGMPMSRDSMTSSGLMALAVGRAAADAKTGKDEAADPAVHKALHFLGDLFDRGIPPAAPADKAKADALRTAAQKVNQAYVAAMGRGLLGNQKLQAKDLADLKAEVENALTQDLPADAKKQLQQVLDDVKRFDDGPTERRKQDVMTAMQTFLVKGGGLGGFGGLGLGMLGGGNRFLKPRAGAAGVPGLLGAPGGETPMDDIYCLWSMERMAVVYDFKTIAGHDWYAWGADLLVGYQNEDGSWTNTSMLGPGADTSLALLFLKRANVAKDLTAKLQLLGTTKDAPLDKTSYKSPGETASPGLNPSDKPAAPVDPPKEAPKP